jgi:uncharacterized repeat protein (TIGR03803 family)
MLAGCGGSQPPLGSSPAGLVPQPSRVHPAYRVLHSFGGSGDGSNPYPDLINVRGTLYGTTANGGANNAGTVFAIAKTGKETVLRSFGGSGNGSSPYADLINVKGTLYGTTANGGTDGYSSGTVFAIKKSGAETVLHSFGAPGDGTSPFAGLLNVSGTLYGTTIDGGAYSSGSYTNGTVFAITTSGTETMLHSFGIVSGDGVYPYAALLNVEGTLYGTTEYGGAYGSGSGSGYSSGTVFKIKKSGTETVLHSFGRSGDGAQPVAGLINVDGTLYGTTPDGGADCGSSGGCGTVFKITTSGTESVLYSFKGGSHDGYGSTAGLLNVNGTLYGTTLGGGATDNGTVFAITTSGAETVLHSFKGGSGDGSKPYAGLINVKGTLYGTTTGGGAQSDGTVFSLKP